MVPFGPKVSVSTPLLAVVVLHPPAVAVRHPLVVLHLVSFMLLPIQLDKSISIQGSNNNPYAAPAGTLDNYGNAASGYPAPAASTYNNMGSGYMQGDPHVRITTPNQPDVCYDVKKCFKSQFIGYEIHSKILLFLNHLKGIICRFH